MPRSEETKKSQKTLQELLRTPYLSLFEDDKSSSVNEELFFASSSMGTEAMTFVQTDNEASESQLFCSQNMDHTLEKGLPCEPVSSDDAIEDDDSVEEGFNCESDTEDDSEILEVNLTTRIAEWSSRQGITKSALNELLCILRDFHPFLPKDGRTIIKTLKSDIHSTDVRNITDEIKYFHVGLTKNLEFLATKNMLPPNYILKLNFDGLPIYKSSKNELWPILAQVNNNEPFIVGSSFGPKKPPVKEYLQELIYELKILTSQDLNSSNLQCISVDKIKVICDAPARSHIKQIKSHTGYFGCDGCHVEGEYLNNRMVFFDTESPLRNDDTFLDDDHSNHRIGISPFCEIKNFHLISSFPRDPMHNLFLGVTRKLIQFWLKGPSKTIKLTGHEINTVSLQLINAAKFTPREFSRKPRSLSDLDRWKATEFRSFALYLGPIIMKDILSNDSYKHFMLFSCAIRILSTKATPEQIKLAEELLKNFVIFARPLYGDTFNTYNVHSLLHVAADCQLHGPLDEFSAFPFESFLYQMKRAIKEAPKNPLQSLKNKVDHGFFHRRQIRNATIRDANSEMRMGPLVSDCITHTEHKYLQLKTGYVTKDMANCFWLLDTDIIVAVRSIIQLKPSGAVKIRAKKESSKMAAFEYPFSSSKLSIYIVQFSENEIEISPQNLLSKLYGIQRGNGKVAVMPLIHTYE